MAKKRHKWIDTNDKSIKACINCDCKKLTLSKPLGILYGKFELTYDIFKDRKMFIHIRTPECI